MSGTLPDARFGSATASPADWRAGADEDNDPDDTLLAVTPPDVVAMLGFDPLEFE